MKVFTAFIVTLIKNMKWFKCHFAINYTIMLHRSRPLQLQTLNVSIISKHVNFWDNWFLLVWYKGLEVYSVQHSTFVLLFGLIVSSHILYIVILLHQCIKARYQAQRWHLFNLIRTTRLAERFNSVVYGVSHRLNIVMLSKIFKLLLSAWGKFYKNQTSMDQKVIVAGVIIDLNCSLGCFVNNDTAISFIIGG